MAATISSTDVHKIQRHNVGDMKDMITNLPEGVLLHILSLLPTKDAVKTSILATKWRHLWTYLSAFDFEETYGSDVDAANQNLTNCLIDLVGRLLEKSNRVERLGIQTIRTTTVGAEKVGSLISSAMTHKIQSLRLSLGDRKNKLVLPHCFSAFESLIELRLGLNFTLHVPNGIRFTTLKKLIVSDVTFANEESVQLLLSACPVLQKLTLYHCSWENMKQISVAISTLRKLGIHFDYRSTNYDHDMTLKIDAVNLLSLRCACDPPIEVIPVNLTSLVDARFDMQHHDTDNELYAAHCAFELLRGLSNLTTLKITNDTLECLYHTKDTLHLLPSFHNLTHLYVWSPSPERANIVLMDILRKTPKLEFLHIPGVVLDYLGGQDSIPNPVPSLNRLCICNFVGNKWEIEFVTFFLKNAPLLGEIEIYCSRRLSCDMDKVYRIWDQLEAVGTGSCVVLFCSHYYEPNDEYDDDDYYDEIANPDVLPDDVNPDVLPAAANPGVLPAAEGVQIPQPEVQSVEPPIRQEVPVTTPEAMMQALEDRIIGEFRGVISRLEHMFTTRLNAIEARMENLEDVVSQIPTESGQN